MASPLSSSLLPFQFSVCPLFLELNTNVVKNNQQPPYQWLSFTTSSVGIVWSSMRWRQCAIITRNGALRVFTVCSTLTSRVPCQNRFFYFSLFIYCQHYAVSKRRLLFIAMAVEKRALKLGNRTIPKIAIWVVNCIVTVCAIPYSLPWMRVNRLVYWQTNFSRLNSNYSCINAHLSKTLHHSQLLVPHLLHRHNKSIHLEMGLRTHHCDMAHIHGAHSHHVLLCICALWLLLLFWRFAATWQETDSSRVRSEVD